MEVNEIVRRLEKIASYATHIPGEPLFVLLSLDNGIALMEAIELLKKQDKQIDDLKAELAKTEDNFSEYAEMMQEKQEPVEPENGKCPECGYTVHRINYDGLYNGIRHEWFRFCPSCGRAVKWDD